MMRRFRQHGQVVGDAGHDVPRFSPVKVIEREALKVDEEVLPHLCLHACSEDMSPAQADVIGCRDQKCQYKKHSRRSQNAYELHARQVVVEYPVDDHRQQNRQSRL